MTVPALCQACALPAMVLCGCLLAGACSAQGQPQSPGAVKVSRLLVLGNSITLHGPHEPYGWRNYCGMAASVPEKDYVHLLAAALEARTGSSLRLSPTETPGVDGAAAEPANVVNVADIFERNYAPFDPARLARQLAWKPDLVVLQVGENVVRETFDANAFREGLRALLAALKASGDPHVFVTGQILGSGGALDEIKRELCAEDPANRCFVDLSDFGRDPGNLASAEPYYTGVIVGHPGDKGMALIAETLLRSIVAHFAPPDPAKP